MFSFVAPEMPSVDGWSSLHATPLYKAFQPDSPQGLARLVELIVFRMPPKARPKGLLRTVDRFSLVRAIGEGEL